MLKLLFAAILLNEIIQVQLRIVFLLLLFVKFGTTTGKFKKISRCMGQK